MSKSHRKTNIMPKAKVRTKVNLESEDMEKPLPTVLTKAEGLVSNFSDGLLLHHSLDIFTLSFLQIQYPLIATQGDAKEIKSIEQRCVAQIIVTPEQMARNVGAIIINFKSFVAKQSPEVQKILNELAGFAKEYKEAENDGNN